MPTYIALLNWTQQGASKVGGSAKRLDAGRKAFKKDGWNHFVIRAYNNSTSYALAVGLFADRMRGGGQLVTPWPVEAPLSRADKAAAKLKAMIRVTATALRDGQAKELPLRELVPGDVIKLSAGDMIPADLRLIEAKDLFINQSALFPLLAGPHTALPN